MSDTVKIRVGMGVHYIAGSNQENVVDSGIPRAEWDAMPEEDRQQILDGLMDTEIANNVDVWAHPAEDSDE